ncbi:hypothetical protein BCR43DRAFT_487753 [Syncephalastrum racemosum]|uniref:Uncharacterized protein n=1 Tax=Syncephalastrum racemosum TaxID=13706 RepID=A0A1X2HHM1_SYNRA|nr:hypothetical protein BCR43DRAFT_487753 [Syncephalastrum racemosum]
MTHLTDFSYLQRCVLEVYISAYLLYTIWQNDRFRCLKPSKIIDGELRSIITYLMILMMITQSSWDIISTWIKYSEGFLEIPTTGQIITKPFAYWKPEHQRFIQPIDYIECVTFAMQTGVFFLLQCFWNYLSNTVVKKSFMGSWEFKFYIIWALGSAAMFPVLQWRYSNDELLSEVVPQLAYSIEVLITAALGIRSHFRFSRLIRAAEQAIVKKPTSGSTDVSQGQGRISIVVRLRYFRSMNTMLVIVLGIYGTSLLILCADGLTTSMAINSKKISLDILIATANMSVVFLWLLFISIFHPRRHQVRQEQENDEEQEPKPKPEPRNTRTGRLSARMSKLFVMNESTKRYNENASPGWQDQQASPSAPPPVPDLPADMPSNLKRDRGQTPVTWSQQEEANYRYYYSSPPTSPGLSARPPPVGMGSVRSNTQSPTLHNEIIDTNSYATYTPEYHGAYSPQLNYQEPATTDSTGWLRQSPERRAVSEDNNNGNSVQQQQ